MKMSEVNPQITAVRDNNEPANAPTAMQEVNLALKECGLGLFHIRLMCTSFFGVAAGVAVLNSTPYILPIAECDLNMSLLEKGVLNAMPFVGMVLISVVAGFLTDIFGRKFFILSGFSGLFIFTAISGTSQTYLVLAICKFFEGLLSATAFSPMITLTSEFCHSDIRDRVMLLQSSFTAISQIAIALMSWAILPQHWEYTMFNGAIVFNTWNFYLFIMSLWSLTATLLFAFLPESPKYYITQKRYDEARDILIKIYKQNTRKPADTFPYKNIWKEKTKQDIEESSGPVSRKNLGHMLSAGLHNVKVMLHKPRGLYLLLFCTLNFFSMLLYNVIRMWFPQLSTIVEHYSTRDSQDLCVMLDTYTHDLSVRSSNVTVDEVCIPAVSGTETYINTVILGCVCIAPYIITGVLVNKVGKKNLYIACCLISVGATLGLRWASSKIGFVALFSFDVSISQTMKSLNQALVVELFPTTIRSLSLAMIMTIGRIGSVVGNILFPILLDMGCAVPFFTLAGTMIGTTLLSLVIPVKKK
ncbi:synaptic vesicle glycoprotein 2B-like [Maniola hyperantus]|uniref:synaptic vesicle glycoprotein 2B-like n=1 Tax=Aphantopus hyperantus TaxID=2795564 RepID=UPI00156A6C7D|nr:synaptic vesicle glycoprotein 2B-like [Maniola hyperantus]